MVLLNLLRAVVVLASLCSFATGLPFILALAFGRI